MLLLRKFLQGNVWGVLAFVLSACGGTYHSPAPVEIHAPGEYASRRMPIDQASASGPKINGPAETSKLRVSRLPEPVIPSSQNKTQPPKVVAQQSVDQSKPLPKDQIKHVPEVQSLPSPPSSSTPALQFPPSEIEILPPQETTEASNLQTSTQRATVAQDAGHGLKFMWPVTGEIVGGFGATADELHNDGINIKARKGTPVRAAEAGTVVFAGENVRAFGQLVLIKHIGGWTSAYAHLQKSAVKKGDKIKRGQIIAYSGDSGNVTSPQLHFELRKQVKPVDPVLYLGL